jgi:coenzyme F420-0:L-glutamate ligase / coenzyme F420-1:gamma-L-glutamate ligase
MGCCFFFPITIIPVKINKNIKEGDNISELILEALNLNNLQIYENDVIVIAQKIISKSENRILNLKDVIPSKKALEIFSIHEKDPRLIELILRESLDIIRITNKNLIVETKYGFICANAGIDQSNVSVETDVVLLLPENPDESAKKIRKYIYHKLKKNVSVIISDTFGRPFRKGQTNIAIGIAGICPLKSYVGSKDSFGKVLRVTEIAIVDELASSAELVMGKTLEVPVAIIRGYGYQAIDLEDDDDDNVNYNISIKSLFREKSQDLFRN